jgi:diguanylate cyclase (GGDEF)-like protein
MLRVISCIAVEHSLSHLLIATVICLLGSLLTVRLFTRVRRTQGLQKLNWLFLAGFVGGSTIWTTHFIAMLGYRASVLTGYEPGLTLLSLFIGITSAMIGFGVASVRHEKSRLVEAGGAIVGLGVAAMHYVGITGFKVAGQIEWDQRYVVASLISGALFGALMTNRVARSSKLSTKLGASIPLILAIVTTHFIGMAGMTVVPDSSVAVPAEILSVGVMTALVGAVMIIILLLGASTYILDMQSTTAAVARYRHLSLHDPLTHLANRAALNEHLPALTKRLTNPADRIAVLCFDLDRFKEINDVHGHAAGDAVLRAIGERLNKVSEAGQFAARVGGDEFVVIAVDQKGLAEVPALAQRLLDDIQLPVEWNGQILSVGSSIGISSFPDRAKTVDDLLSQADVAMYRAKTTVGGNICFYDPSMDEAVRARSALAIEMREGLKQNEFLLFYQRQNDTVSREVIGLEALLRWRHPTRGYVSPNEFIPIAEKTGFIMELGEWVLRTACAEAATWTNPLRIAVNVAPQQLADSRLPQTVQQILKDTGLDPSRLEVEITESGIIADHAHALTAIRRLKALGVRVAMDDYGTGYSSLSTLQSFPFDKIKIDRAFIDGVVTNKQSAAIVRSTLILAQSLDIPVLAEGVEKEEHIDFLRREGCLQVQGFLFGRPAPRQDIEALVNGGPNAIERQQVADPVIRDAAA